MLAAKPSKDLGFFAAALFCGALVLAGQISAEEVFLGAVSGTSKTGEAEAHLKVSGSKSSQFQYTFMDGPNSGLFTNGLTRRETLDMKVSGALEGGIKVLGTFQQSDDLLDDKISLSLAAPHWELYLGDLNAEMPGTEMVLRSQNLSGARFSGDSGRIGWMALAAVPKGQSRYIRIFGNGTQGPYLLGAAPVVPESETVLVDKLKKVRGSDYDVDYFNGQIVFKSGIIGPSQLIEIIFQSRDTPYERRLYGLQLSEKIGSALTLRQYFASQDDREAAAFAPIGLSSTAFTAPMSHSIFGQVLEYRDQRGKVALEYDFSERNLDKRLGDFVHGHAGTALVDYELGDWKLKSGYKRSSSGYQSIGGVDQGEDLLDYNGLLDYRPSAVFQAAGSYGASQRQLATGYLATRDGKARAEFRPARFPWLKYQFTDESREDEAVVSPLGPLLQRTRRHLGEISQDLRIARIGAQYEMEQLNGHTDLLGVTATPRLQSDAMTGSLFFNIDRLTWLTAALSGAYKMGQLQDEDLAANNFDFTQRVLKGDLSLHGGDAFTLSGGGQSQDDSVSGLKNTLHGKLTLRYASAFSLESAYQWDSLQTFVFSQYVPADTRSASGRLELSPWRPLSLALSGNRRATELKDDGRILNAQEGQNAQLKWAAAPSLSLEGGVGRDFFSLLNTSDPALPLQSEQTVLNQNYAAKYAFTGSSSIETGYSTSRSQKRQQALLTGQYDNAESQIQKASFALRSAMSDRLRLEGDYHWEGLDQTGSSAASLTLTPAPLSQLVQEAQNVAIQAFLGDIRYDEHRAEAKLTWDLLQWLALGVSGAYDSHLRRGVGHRGTVTEGALLGLKFSKFNGELTYKASQSLSAAGGQQQIGGNLSWRPADFLTLALRGEYTQMETSQATRVSLNVTEAF